MYRFFVGKSEGRCPMWGPIRRWVWYVARMVEERGVYRFLVGKSEGRCPMWGPRRRCVWHVARMGEESVV